MLVEEKADAELVAEARGGDKRAFDQLVTRYQPLAQRAARRMIANEEIARDLAQEAMLQAYLSVAELREGDRFMSWLYGIVLNVCRSYLRSQKTEPLSLEALTGGLHLDALRHPEADASPVVALADRERHGAVLRAISALSPRDRVVARMFYGEQRPLKEIAAMTGASVPAVKNRLYRARKELRERLSPLYPELARAPAAGGTRKGMIKATIAGVVEEERPEGRSAAVVLQDEAGQRALRIWMAPSDAGAIDLGLHGRSFPRPMTYSFMAALLEAAGAKLEEVRIEGLKEGVFYATAKLRRGKTVRELEARPSDALALALHVGSPIYIAEEIMGQAGMDLPDYFREAREALPEAPPIPERLPIMPVRGRVFFPREIVPLFVGRDKSKRALAEAQSKDGSIILLTQKQASVDDPGPEDVYHVGTVVRVVQILYLPDQTIRVLVEGTARVRVLEYLQTDPYHYAQVEPMPEEEDRSPEAGVLMQKVRAQLAKLAEQGQEAPGAVRIQPSTAHLERIDELGRLADALAASLQLPEEAMQQILETLPPRERLEKLSSLLP